MISAELERSLREALESRDLAFAILFGSTVTRGPDAARDVDLAIRARAPMSSMESAALAVELERSLGESVDVIDVDEAHTLLQWEIVRTGHVIVAADIDALRNFQVRAAMDYADLRPYLDLEAEGLRRTLGVV